MKLSKKDTARIQTCTRVFATAEDDVQLGHPSASAIRQDGSVGEKGGVCPICGSADISYDGTHDIEGESTKCDWHCPVCKAEGTEWCDIEFSRHEDLTDKDGEPFTEEELSEKNMECGEICPMCGGELEYNGDQDIFGETTEVTWGCQNCGATGTQVSNIVFSEHTINS